MDDSTGLRLNTEALAQYGLPDIPYPINAPRLAECLQHEGQLPFAALLHGLQERSATVAAGWQALEPAMERLAELIAPTDERPLISAAGEDWWLEIGPVELDGPLVTIQREEYLIATIMRRADGRLRIAAFRALDGKSARYLMDLARTPHPQYGVAQREDNWEYARDQAAANGNFYAADRGEAYVSGWDRGLGISADSTEIQPWRQQRTLVARSPAHVATELGVQHAYSG